MRSFFKKIKDETLNIPVCIYGPPEMLTHEPMELDEEKRIREFQPNEFVPKPNEFVPTNTYEVNEEQQTITCNSCGATTVITAKFCPECGAPLLAWKKAKEAQTEENKQENE